MKDKIEKGLTIIQSWDYLRSIDQELYFDGVITEFLASVFSEVQVKHQKQDGNKRHAALDIARLPGRELQSS